MPFILTSGLKGLYLHLFGIYDMKSAIFAHDCWVVLSIYSLGVVTTAHTNVSPTQEYQGY